MSMFKSAATKIAHNSTIPSLGGNKDLRPLQDLITAEKVVLISLQKLSVDFAKASEALRAWGVGEGDDLGDTLSASTTLLNHFSSALSQYAAHGHPMRDHLKSIRTREENLDDLKRRRKNVGAKAESAERKLSKMSPEHKNLPMQTDTLNSLRSEIHSLDSEIMSEEAGLGDFKRSTTRAWMGLKFGGLVECAEKGTIAGEYGRLVIAEIPEEQTQPGLPRSLYYGQPKTESLVSEAHRCINEVALSVVPSSNTQRPNVPQLNNTLHQSQHTSYQDGTVDPRTGFPLPPAAGGWSPPYSNDIAPTSDRPPNYLLPPQNLGTGHFLDQPNMSAPGSPTQPQYATQTMPHYPQIEQHESVPQRSVDDFGVNQGPSSPIDPPGPGGAGRFATFPVKTRTPGGSGFALRDDPPSLNSHQEVGDSFSSSVAEALGTSQPHQQYESPPRVSLDRPAPLYENAPMYSPPQGPPPGAYTGSIQDYNTSPPSQGGLYPASHTGQTGRHSPNDTDDDPVLAYMTTPHDDHDNDIDQPHPGGHDVGKHVRFGRVSDVDEEIDRRGGPHQPSNGHPPQYAQPSQKRLSMDSGHAVSPPSNRLSFNSADASPVPAQRISPTADHRFQNQQRIPPPTMDPEDEERALNAAAAREVSRELDSLNFNPPAPIPKDSAPVRDLSPDRGQEPQYSPEFNNSPLPNSDMSPLAPPAAPFARRAPSPRPGSDVGTPPYPGASPYMSSAPYTPPQTYTEPQTYHQETPNEAQPYMSRDGQTSPTSPTGPRLNTSIPPAINLPDNTTARYSPSNQSPYQTPPEYPRGLGTPNTRSTTSLNSQIPAGARTISAAAFKRPPQRMASGDIGMGTPPMSDTSPLSFKKRLPSSPYPQQREASPMSRGPTSSISRHTPPPQAPPSTTLPPVPGDDDNYDYLSAYMSSSPPSGETAGGPLRDTKNSGNNGYAQGYGEGRFATNLEGGLR
ncbi:hypothetical protein BDZ94DRAFT_1202761 [Collybia nuda]|uniref:Eisosome component PIL1-domain-containing protein n=1 Tax=Collybia nuda TaxID=64659 RepID=A0A9P5XV63_9AGAR|nr:hypothetical protein BDZ94DRAFT_1202761 [Collybia nuda]